MNESIIQNSKLNIQHYIDWHSHILPGLDDGAADLEESLAIARALAAAGFGRIHCTPHSITGAYDAAPHLVRRAVGELGREVEREGLPLRLVAGAEYYWDEFLPDRLDDPLPLGGSNLILMEAPSQAAPEQLTRTAFQVILRGFTPLIAHPERCALFSLEKKKRETTSLFASVLNFAKARFSIQNSTCNTQHSTSVEHTTPADLLRSMGCRFQGNIGSFAGLYGERVRSRAVRLLREGLYDCLGTDAHSPRGIGDWLPRGLEEIEAVAGGEGLEALLSGSALKTCYSPQGGRVAHHRSQGAGERDGVSQAALFAVNEGLGDYPLDSSGCCGGKTLRDCNKRETTILYFGDN